MLTADPHAGHVAWRRMRGLVLACLATCLSPSALRAEPANDDFLRTLATSGLEDLLRQEVTSAGKKAQSLRDVSAAVFVLSAEEIERSGATTIPDLLRLVPGLEVAQIDAHQWVVSSRGFNGLFANKLLALIDGRAVYTPLFGGVNWDEHNVPIGEIERIEVIRGPGAAVWGANALNGVINIITKRARESQGWSVSASAGNREGGATVRNGVQLGDASWLRTFAKTNTFGSTDRAGTDGDGSFDAWNMSRGGIEFEHGGSDSHLVLQGEGYGGREQEEFLIPFPQGMDRAHTTIGGGFGLARWEGDLGGGSHASLQSSLQFDHRDSAVLSQREFLWDSDAEVHVSPAPGHDLVAGLNYRLFHERIDAGLMDIIPEHKMLQRGGIFAQDEIGMFDRSLLLTLGGALEYADLGGVHFQPTIRTLWHLSDSSSVWAAISRAHRVPTLVERGVRLDLSAEQVGGRQIVSRLTGVPDSEAERLTAYELGYRMQPFSSFGFDAATFFNQYHQSASRQDGEEFAADVAGTSVIVDPVNIRHSNAARSWGGELSLFGAPASWWQVRAGYTWLRLSIYDDSADASIISTRNESASPQHQAFLVSRMDLPYRLQFDSTLRYVSSVPAYFIPPYTELDVRLGYPLSERFFIELIGRNLLHARHAEYFSNFIRTAPTELQRTFLLRARWRF